MTTHYADAVFAILPHLESTKALYDVIKRSAVEAGRSLFRVQPISSAPRAPKRPTSRPSITRWCHWRAARHVGHSTSTCVRAAGSTGRSRGGRAIAR